MATQTQLRRGSTTDTNNFTGAVGEVTVDTDKNVVVAHDGSTQGGFPHVLETRTLTGGDGIQSLGDLSADRTVAVDSTVARTNAANNFGPNNQSIDANGGRLLFYDSDDASATFLAFEDSGGNQVGSVVMKGTDGANSPAQIDWINFSSITIDGNSIATVASNTFTGTQLFPDGTASAPSIANDGDTDTGVFFPAANTIGWATGGTEGLRLDSNRQLGIGKSPSSKLDVAGLTRLNGASNPNSRSLALDTDAEARSTTEAAWRMVSDTDGGSGGPYEGRIAVQQNGELQLKSPIGNGLTHRFRSGNGEIAQLKENSSGGMLGLGIGDPSYQLEVNGEISSVERSSDPSNPPEGQYVMWQSDGTGSGADGDIMLKITAGSTTKTITLVDFSAN